MKHLENPIKYNDCISVRKRLNFFDWTSFLKVINAYNKILLARYMQNTTIDYARKYYN
jgi:hypothetical protein